jgi:hypothetical protein
MKRNKSLLQLTAAIKMMMIIRQRRFRAIHAYSRNKGEQAGPWMREEIKARLLQKCSTAVQWLYTC